MTDTGESRKVWRGDFLNSAAAFNHPLDLPGLLIVMRELLAEEQP